MKQTHREMEFDVTQLPVTIAVRVERHKGYGTVADLEDEAPADINELNRITAWQMWMPLLSLGRRAQPLLTPSGDIDWQRIRPVNARRYQRPHGGINNDPRQLLARLHMPGTHVDHLHASERATARARNTIQVVEWDCKTAHESYTRFGFVPDELLPRFGRRARHAGNASPQ